MYLCVEHALYRAFNVSELFFQRNQLANLYRSPDWESRPAYTSESLTTIERIHEDSRVFRLIQSDLSNDAFHLLRIMYCRSLDVEDWRYSLHSINPKISMRIGRIKYNPMVYEYTCIKQLTGNKMKSLYIKNESARRNSKKICSALSDLSELAHQKAEHLLLDRGVLKSCQG